MSLSTITVSTQVQYQQIDSWADIGALMEWLNAQEGLVGKIFATADLDNEICLELEGVTVETVSWPISEVFGKRILFDGTRFELVDPSDQRFTAQ
ncbi:hypothetical protein BCA37_10825 [Mycobacterium sp. djl-10]|nr:hypothetical protein BCA37_10825 [Mycobacterium sp. djl-10]